MRPLTAMVVCAIAAVGCGRPASPHTAHVAPPQGIDVPIASAAPAPDASIDAPPRSPLDDVGPACRGSALSFDTEESENPCLVSNAGSHDVPPSPGPTELEITATVTEKSVAPGGTATIVVTMTNRTSAPMLLHVDYTCDAEAGFAVDVFDAHKKRVDYISHKNCDTNTYGCTRRVLRLVLDPGGSMRKVRSFAAKVTKIAADCGEVPAGPIKPGRYVLEVVTGLLPAPDSPYHSRLDTTLVVK